MNTKQFKCSDIEWNRFVREAVTEDTDDTNVKGSFKNLCSKYGKAYLTYLEASYLAKDEMSDGEFCKLNGDVPKEFLKKLS